MAALRNFLKSNIMKKLLFILSVILALSSCTQTKPITNDGQYLSIMVPGEWEPFIEPYQIQHAVKKEVFTPQCYVDLQAISIDPGTPWLTIRKKTYVQADMKNNGPSVIPAGQATCQITINNRFLAFPYKHNFGSAHWELVKINRKIKGQVNLFFKNKREIRVNEIAPFRFDITGKAQGIADITLASSLSRDASCSDYDGQNQSVRTEVIITK